MRLEAAKHLHKFLGDSWKFLANLFSFCVSLPFPCAGSLDTSDTSSLCPSSLPCSLPSALLCVLLHSAPDPGGMWGRGCPGSPTKTDSLAWVMLGVHKLSKASQIYNHGAGWFSCCLQPPAGPALLICDAAQSRQEAFSEAPGVFWDKGTAGVPRPCLAVQEYGAEPHHCRALGRNNPAYFFPGSIIHGTNSPSRESNTERNNKALSVIKLISSWIGKVWQCLGGCGRLLELEHPQRSTSPLGSSGKHGSAPADSPCSSLGSADGATPPLCRPTTSSPQFPWR